MSKPIAVIAFRLPDALRARAEEVCEPRFVPAGAPRAELLAAVADAEGLLVVNNVSIDGELLAAAPKLRVVSGYGVGYDCVDVPAVRSETDLPSTTAFRVGRVR